MWTRCGWQLATVCLRIFEKLKTLSNGVVVRIKLSCTSIGVDGICNLIVATFIQAPKVKPNFRYVWVDTNDARIGIDGVAVLIDIVIKQAELHQNPGLRRSR